MRNKIHPAIITASFGALTLEGWWAALLAWPMLTGQEELTRWTTHDISNGTAMFFGVSLGFLVLMLYLASRAENKKTRLLIQAAGYGGCFALMGIMSIATPFGLKGQ